MSEQDAQPVENVRPVPDPRRVVAVTGGTGALGRRIVRRFSANGNPVHVPVRSGSGGGPSADEGASARMNASAEDGSATEDGPSAEEGARPGVDGSEGGRVTFHPCDVTEAAEVEGFFRSVVDTEGRLDVLVNGVGGFAMASVIETDPEGWREMVEVNATSAFLCSRSAAGFMKDAGWGRIVNVASMPALERGAPGMAAYGAAKTALVHLTRSLAEELVEDGVTVNAVVPTIIDTPANRAAMPDASRERWLDPMEIAEVVIFLASDAAEIVTGAAIPLSRG